MKNVFINQYKIRMDNYLINNLDIIAQEAIPNKWDALFIVFGKEGTGKTTFATQCALYLDHSFKIDRCVFNPDKFGDAIEDADPESSILWDEAITGAMTSQHASKISQIIISKLTQIRKKRLKIFICFPYLYMLNKYFVSRCVASFYIYSNGFTDRGHFIAYNQEQTMWLYALMKDRYARMPERAIYAAQKSFYGLFPDVFCLPEDDYDLKKETARKEMPDEKTDIWQTRAIKAINVGKRHKISQKEYAVEWEVSSAYISQLLSN